MRSETNRNFTAVRYLLGGLLLLGGLGIVFAKGESNSTSPTAPNRYIGAAKCKNCHSDEGSGNQYGAWKEAKHAKAFELLATDKAKEVAKGLGIEDAQKSDKCLKCHTTAFGADKKEIKKGFKIEHGVQCETCHGPGEKHMKARFAAAATAGDDAPAYTPIPEDELIISPPMKLCVECHNKDNPNYKPFCYLEKVKKVRHDNPRKPRTAEEKKKRDEVCACGKECPCENGCPDQEGSGDKK